VRGGTFGRYIASGHLLYVSRGTLFAAPFDLENLEMRGTPTPVLGDVDYSANSGYARLDFSQSGMLLYESGGTGGDQLLSVRWLEPTPERPNNTRQLLAKPGSYGRPSLSPDGLRLALEVVTGANNDVWIYEWQRDVMTRLTFGDVGPANPIWSPDGRRIAFQNEGSIFWVRADGGGKSQQLTQSKNPQTPFSFSPDGKRLSFNEQTPQGFDLWTLPLENDGAELRAGKPEVFLQTPFDERHPMFSTDGKWIAYTSNESGAYEIYVRAFPDMGGKWQLSNSGGSYPEWSRNNHEIFFRSPDDQIMVVTYTTKGDSFAADKPRVWSESRLASFGAVGTKSYDLSPDGKRIAAVMPAVVPETETAQNHVVFLMNFFDEVRRRTGTQTK
jgi:serine/threonine-protein kinase